MPNESNIIEEHLRIVIDPSTYSEINKISESVREMREDFSEMPHLGEMLNSSLERTSTLTDTVNRKLQKASDITFNSQDDKDRFSANANASVEDLRIMHKLQTTNDDFNPTVVRSWAKGLSSALSKELDAIIPDLAGIFRSRMSPLTTAGNSAYKHTFQEVAGLSQAMFHDKSVQDLLKNRVTQSYTDDVIKQLLRVVVANSSPMMRLNEYTDLRYKASVRENAKAAELNSPIALLPASFQSSFKNKGYLSRGEDANEQRKWLTTSAYKVIQKLLAENPVAVNAAVRSGIARRDDRGVLELQRNISRKDYDDLRRSIYGEFTARATGAGEHRVADIYTDDPTAAKIVAGRMAGSSSAGNVIRAMQRLEALESAEAWMDRQRQGSAYIKQPKEPKRVLDQYSILSFAPFDSTKRPQKEVSITESNNTRLLGLQSRGYNGDASDTIATISLSGYDKNNEAHVAELRKLFEEGKEIQSIGGKTVRMRVQSMHRGDDGAILRLVEESAMAAVDERLRPIAEAAGLSGSYWTNYQNIDKFDDLVHYRKHLDARNKGWTPSADLGLNLDGKKIAVVSMSTVDGDHKTELADGTGWLSEGILPTPIQFRGGVSGKGTLRPLPGETNRDFAIRSGLATQDQDGQWHWYVQGANPNDAPIDIIDYNGFVDKSVIKNMSAYRNVDGTLKTSEEINDTFMEMLSISPLSVVKDFSKMDSESDRIGVQMMSFMDISPELQMRQQKQLSKRLQELDTEEGMLKYVFPASNEDYLSTQVNDPEKRWLLQGTEAQKRVALYREELMRKAMSGEWIDFGDDPNDTISNVELAGSPLAAFFRMNGVNDDVRKIAREALTKEFGKKYSDQEIDDILKLRGTKRNADGTIEYGYGIDFGRADQEELGFLRSPTGYGNMVVARNVAKEVQAIYAALAGNIPEGMDSSMFSKDFLEAGGVILAPEDLKTLSGADLDADTVKTVTGRLKDAVKSTIEHTVMMPEKDTQLQITKRKQDGDISDSVENQIAAVDDLTYEPLGMGLYSGAIRGRQFDPTNPEYIDRIRGFHKGQVGYDATTTIFKDPKEIARDKDIDKAIAAGKEYTRFTQNVKDIFSLDEDMYDDKGNVLDAHQDMYRAANGTVINMRKLKELDLLHTNLPSVYMDNHVLGLASMGRQYREGRVDTTRFDAMAEALSHMSEYDQELYSTAGTQTKALMDTVNQLYPQFGTGKRTKLTGDETKQLFELYDGALSEITQQAHAQEILPGFVLNDKGSKVRTDWLIDNLKKRYGLTRVENTLKEFGFTDDRLSVGLPESLQEFFANSADATLNIAKAPQVNATAIAANAPRIVEQLNKAKEEAAAEINKLEQEKAELDEKLFGKEVAGGILSASMTQEEHDQAENRRSEINRLIEAKQNEYQNTDAMQRQAIEWYKDQVEFESVFASAREFNSGLWKSRLSKEAHIEDKSKADLYYNKQHGIANYHAAMLDDLIKRTGLSGEQKENLIKLRSDILSGVDVDFADKTVSNAKYLSESLNARVESTSIDYDKTEHEIDGYIKKLKEAEEYQKKLIDMDSEGKFAEEIKQTGEYIASGYQTTEKLRHNLYTQDIAGEDKMIDRLQRFTRDRNRRYSQSAFERQMLVNENDYEQYEQQYEALSHRLGIWQSRRRGLVANGQIDTENYRLATQEIERLSSALSDCQKEMDSLSGINGKLNAGLVVTGQAAARVIEQFGRRMFHQAMQEARRFVVEYDAAMTEIQMVTLKTDEEIASLGDDFIDKAIDLKKSVSDVTTAATALYRQGLSDEAVDERLSDIIKFQTVANVKTEDATKLITVALSGGMVDSAEDAMDVISALGDSAATTAGEITKGLQKSMYAAKEVGVTYEELVAMLTVITSKTQLSGSVAGTTMQTVLSRLARVGSSELIYDENGKAISGSEQARVLRSIGIETYDEGMLRSPFEILSELGKVWEDLEDASRNQVSYALAGTRQYSNFSALMSGFSEKDENGILLMDKYLGIAEESSGITNKKYLQYTESLASNLTDVKNSFDGFVNSIAKADDLNGFLTFTSDALKGLTQFNEQLDGTPSKIILLGTALAGLVGVFNMHNPLLFAAVVAISSLASIGKILNDTVDKPVYYNDRISNVEQSYSTSKTALQNAQRLNKTRDSDGVLSSGNFNELKNALVQLNSLGFISIDASSSIDELARSASKTAEALDNASVSITQSEQKKKWAAAASSANDYKTSYINEAKKNADNPDPYSGLTLALSQANKNPHVMYTEAVRSFVKKMDSAGYLDLVTLEDGKIWSNLENKWSYRGDKYNYALNGDANLVAKLLELANTPEVMDQTKYISTPFGETQRGTVQTMFTDLYGDDDTGIVDLATDIVVRQMTSAYETDPQFLPSQYMIDPFVGIDGEFDLRKFHSFVQSNASKEYDKILQTTAEKNRAAAQKTPIQKMGPIVSGAVAADTSNYGDAYVNIADIVRTAPGATTGERISNITKAMNTVVPNWAAIFTDKENLDLAKTFNELLVYDENIKDFVPNESADQSVFDALLRILYGKDKRTAELGTYRPQNVVATSAQKTFDRLTAEGVDTENVWRNLSDVTEINSLTQEELISILGKDLTASLINGQLDTDGLAYAQSLIDKAAAIASVVPSDTAKDVQNMITALMGTSSEQMKQFSTSYNRDESLSHGMYAYNRIAVTGGTDDDFTTLGEALGIDIETVKRLSSTNEGKKLLENSLNKQIKTFSSTLSDALIAMLPDPSILATMSGFDSNQIAEALSGTLSEGALSIIQMLGGRIQNGEFVFDVDAMSTLKTPGQAHYNVMKELNENNPEFRMYEAMADSIEGISKWGGTFDSFLSQYATTKDEDWEDFYRNNPSIAARKSAYDAGQISSDEFYNFIRAEQYGSSEKTTDYYDPALRMLLGENYKDGVSDWDAVSSNYEAMMSTPVGQQFIEDIKELEGGSDILTELSDSMGDVGVNGERCGEALDLVLNGLNSKATTQALKYDRALSKVQSTMKSLSDEGEDAAMATLDLYETTRNLSNASWALDKYQSGDRSDKVTGILSKQFSIDQTDLKKAADDQATAYYEAMHAAYEDRVAILKENFAQNFSDISSYINDFQSATGTEFDIGNYVVNGRVDVSALLKAFSEAGVIVDQTWAAVVTAMAGAGATFTVGADGNSLSLDVSNLSTGGGKYYGGGSGGSKKSSADKLVERLGHGESLFDHQIKMVQYEQTKYENADELGNYGKMLEEEIKIERAYLPVLQSNIAALRSELANVKEGSEDWYKLRDAILEAEEKYADINNTIAENEKKLKENHQAILKLHTDLEEMVVGEIELRIDAEKEMLDGSVSMQDTILNAIKDRYRDEWDLIKQDIEKKKEALQQEKDLIDERLDARRNAEDEAAKYEELAELKKQLSLISMDSTRTKDAAALRESIAELEKEIGWDIAEKEAENEKNAIQDQIDAYDDYITKGDEDLETLLEDANNFSEEVNGVLKLSQSELFEWLKQNVKEYANSLDDAQKQMVQSWEATYKQMLGITDTYWDEVNAILSSKDTFLNYMKQSNEYIYASDDERAQLLYQWEEAYDKWQKAQKNDADYSHGDSGLGNYSGSEYTGSSGSSGSSGGSGNSNTTNNQYTGTPNESGWASSQYSENNYRVEGSTTDGRPLLSYNDSLETAKAAAASTSKSTGKPVSIYSPDGKLMYKYINGQAIAYGTTAQASGASGNSNAHWKYIISYNGNTNYYSKDGFTSQSAAQTAGSQYIKDHKLSGAKYRTKYYALGGIADYTGLAWLDGTKERPERILSAQQTEDFDELVSIMDDLRSSGITTDLLRDMMNWSTMINVPSQLSYIGNDAYRGNIANIGDIHVTVQEAQINDDRDIDDLAEIVGQKFVKEISKQGFNIAHYNF